MIEKLPVFKEFPEKKENHRLILWLRNEIYAPISRRINWLVNLFTATDDGEGGEFAPGFGPVSYIDFDIEYMDGQQEGRLQWNLDDGTLEVGMPGGSVNLQIGQEMLVRVTNNSGGTILNGTPVYVSGATGSNITIDEADADFDSGIAFRTIGLATEDIADGQKGYITLTGFVRDIDTSMFGATGQPAYLAVGGGLSASPPVAPDVTILIGVVTRVSASVGEIYVDLTSIPNLSSLSDVTVTSIADSDLLRWNTANRRFENEPTPFGNMWNHDVPTAVSIIVSNTPTRIPSGFTVGQLDNVVFQNARELVVAKAGKYLVNWDISFTTASANQEIEGGPMVNATSIGPTAGGTAHRRISTATDTGNMGATTILDLAANDVVSLQVTNETSTANVIVEHGNLSIYRMKR